MLKGWRRVDTLRAVTVPRGFEEGLLRESQGFVINQQHEKARSRPHSKKVAYKWATEAWGHAPPVDLRNPSDMAKALQNPDALVLRDTRQITQEDVQRVHQATGLLVQAAVLRKVAATLNGQQRTREILGVAGIDTFRGGVRSYGQADPAALMSTVPAQPPPTDHGIQTPLPAPQFAANGLAVAVSVGQSTVVGVGAIPPPPPALVAAAQPLSEAEKLEKRRADARRWKQASRDRKRSKESAFEKEQRREDKSIENSKRNRSNSGRGGGGGGGGGVGGGGGGGGGGGSH